MIINHSILQIFDLNSDLCIISQKEMDMSSENVNSYLEKHLQHIQSDVNKMSGKFNATSLFLKQLTSYLDKGLSFAEFSGYIGNTIYEQISRSDKPDSADLVITDFLENSIRFVAVLLVGSKIAYTHQVDNTNGVICNQIIRHYAILPNVNQKINCYAIINCKELTVEYSDEKRLIDGHDTFIFPERLLQCTSSISTKEAIKTIGKIATKIADEHGTNSAIILSKAKNYLFENAEVASSFSPKELGEEIFAESENMQNEFKMQIQQAKLPANVKLEKNIALRTGKNHKIKTDTGIEITYPAEYFENHDYIQFINNPNGTLSIELKNIGKITNK